MKAGALPGTSNHPAAREKPAFASVDFDKAPFIVIWEATQACDLACVHCRAEARPWRDPLELSTEESKKLINQIRDFGHPLFVITGGDPLKRPDLFELIDYANAKGLRTTLTPSGTKLMTFDVIRRLKETGLARMAVSLDGHTKEMHDAFRKVEGSFEWTMQCIRHARSRAIDLPVQINTTITRHNKAQVREIAEMLAKEDIALWAVFFLVPVGRGAKDQMLDAEEHEEVFHLLYDLAKEMPYDIKTTAAQHYRRVVIQRRRAEAAAGIVPDGRSMEPGGWSSPDFLTGKARPAADAADFVGRSVKGINDGNGFVFISHHGEVWPSGFLPISGGNVRKTSLVDIYRDSPLFKEIRDYAGLKGKCGWCDFRDLCGGSRSRSYGVSGDYMASEPYCAYLPPQPA